MPFTRGDRIGSYEILGPLGSGGMGEVYRAHDPKLNRDIAIKILQEPFAADAERRRRFEREAQTVAALNHPGIVTIYSVESAGDVIFLTMELVEGKRLLDLVPRAGMPLARVLDLMIPFTEAIGAAHQRGITHRDLKPANIMVTPDGRVKVLDFGIAKFRNRETPAHSTITTEGFIIGSVGYMSPEQVQGKSVDHRTDIFSLGIILFELATGQRPFTGDTSAGVMASILRDTPPAIAEMRIGISPDLDRIVAHCLAKDPERRYQTVKEVRDDLAALKGNLISGAAETTVQARSFHQRRRLAIWIGVTATIVAAVAIWIGFTARSRTTSLLVPSFEAVKLTRLTSTGTVTLATISPDGKYVVHVVNDSDGQSLWIRQVATTSNVQIVPPTQSRYDGIAVSPDGNYVYYSTYPGTGNVATLYQVPLLGGTSRRVLEDIDSPVTFAPDGKRFAFIRGFQSQGEVAIMVANLDGSGAKQLAVRKSPDTYPLTNAAWSPDGRVIAVPINVAKNGQRSMSVVTIDAETGAENKIGSKQWDAVTSVEWLGRHGIVLTAIEPGGSPQLWHLTYPTGQPSRITNDFTRYDQVSVTADSSMLVAVQGDRQLHLWVVPVSKPEEAQQITSGTGRFELNPVWTPDGRIAYTSYAGGNADIWIADVDGHNARQLTTDSGNNDVPAVSPDGNTIVFQTARGGGQIWKMDADGGNQIVLTHTSGALPLMSPDGRWVFYTSYAQPQPSVWKISASGGDPIRVSKEPETSDDPAIRTARATFVARAISPDGSLLAGSFLDSTARAFRIGLLSIDRGDLVKSFADSANAPFGLQFTADGRGVTYPDVKTGVWNLWTQPVNGGDPKPVTRFTTPGYISGFKWSRDGRELVVARGPVISDVVLVSNLSGRSP